MNIKGQESILIIQPRPIGDILLTTPIVKYLKNLYPDIKISFLVFEDYVPVIKYNPYIDEILAMKRIKKSFPFGFIKYIADRINLIKKIRSNNYNIVLDYIGLTSSAIIACLSGAECTVGYAHHKGRGFLYKLKAEKDNIQKYTVEKKYDLLKPLGIKTKNKNIALEFFYSEIERDFADKYFLDHELDKADMIVFLSPDSPRSKKRWFHDRYRVLCNALIKKYNAKVLIHYGPGEKKYSASIKDAIGKNAILLPGLGILEAASVLEKADIGIFNCGGMKHISVALGVPSVTIFGSSDPLNWHPPDANYALYLKNKHAPDDPGFGISPDDVLKKIEELLKR